MAYIAAALGGLVPTFLVSRLVLWLLRRADPDGALQIGTIATGHALSLLAAAILYGTGSGDGGMSDRLSHLLAGGGLAGLALYALPQGAWFAFDVWRAKRRGRESQA